MAFDNPIRVGLLRIGTSDFCQQDRNPLVSLAYVSDPVKPAYAECVASWVDDRDEPIEIWKRITAIPELLGYDTETMFGSYDVPNLTMLRLRPWKIRLTVAGDVSARRIWEEQGSDWQ